MANAPIYTTGPQRTSFRLDQDFTAPLSDVLSAEADLALLFSPTSSIIRNVELGLAQGGAEFRDPEALSEMPAAQRRRRLRDPSSRQLTGEDMFGRETSRVLTTEEAQTRIDEAGVPLEVPPAGVTDEALDILIRRKTNELQLQGTLARAESDLLTGAARLGTGLGATLLDPINVASAFIPVVGQARFASMLARTSGRLRRAGVRGLQGGVQGAVGAAAVEPIILSAAQAEQADYDMMDSLLNIAFGTVAGGGLHAGAGVVGDAVRAARGARKSRVVGAAARALDASTHEVREALLRGAVGQMAQGKRPNVQPFADFTPVRAVERKIMVPGEGERIITPDVDVLARELDPVFFNRFDKLDQRASTLRRWIDELREPQRQTALNAVAEYDAEIRRLEKRQQNEGARRKKITQKKIDNIRAERDEIFNGLTTGDTPDIRRIRNELMQVDEQMRDLAPDLTKRYEAAREEAPRRARVEGGEPTFRVETVFERDTRPGIADEIARTYSPENSILGDPEFAAEVDQRLSETRDSTEAVELATADADDVRQQMVDLYEQLGEEAPSLRDEAELSQSIDDLRAGMKAALTCQMRS